MCGTGQSKELDEQSFSLAGKEQWKRSIRFYSDKQMEREGLIIDPNEQKNIDPNLNFYSDFDTSGNTAITKKRTDRLKSSFFMKEADGAMEVGGDEFLENNDILKGIEGLGRPDENFGGVRFESSESMGSGSSPDLLVLTQASHSEVFDGGVEIDFEKEGDEVYKDDEFPPDYKSFLGYGVNDQDNTALDHRA